MVKLNEDKLKYQKLYNDANREKIRAYNRSYYIIKRDGLDLKDLKNNLNNDMNIYKQKILDNEQKKKKKRLEKKRDKKIKVLNENNKTLSDIIHGVDDNFRIIVYFD